MAWASVPLLLAAALDDRHAGGHGRDARGAGRQGRGALVVAGLGQGGLLGVLLLGLGLLLALRLLRRLGGAAAAADLPPAGVERQVGRDGLVEVVRLGQRLVGVPPGERVARSRWVGRLGSRVAVRNLLDRDRAATLGIKGDLLGLGGIPNGE